MRPISTAFIQFIKGIIIAHTLCSACVLTLFRSCSDEHLIWLQHWTERDPSSRNEVCPDFCTA